MVILSVLLYVLGFSFVVFVLDLFLKLLTDREKIKK